MKSETKTVLLALSLLLAPGVAQAQDTTDTTNTTATANQNDDNNDGFDWGWLGLLGLAGLAGLRRQPEQERVVTSTTPR
ncbi:WGxxGxxG family protein [Deinococcus sp. QL22]|uniref:WGxxGxxG family protein n=1 Tax=Deinococcus sp. QL22 TaxID=2939437 RepID=UPI0020180759|nr:WGxxGxxG family protein [Deinococcus sp. QL22]UQN04907.1 WGxxGxxG-CTERM domain-containing protein [Deinococcus sp. QL22]UQN10142.1 WGxxGxxG-CTERM domain-containing protein [Deinococcus sp. QL22]